LAAGSGLDATRRKEGFFMPPITRRSVTTGLVSAAAALALARTARAAPSEQQNLIDKARIAVDEFHADPNFASMKVYMQNAYGVIILPELLKAGLLIGVEAGKGVMLLRDPQSGSWGDPAFYDLYAGSFGLQIGAASTSAVLTLMNPGAIDKILANKFKLGTDASVAAGPVGMGVGAATTTRFGEDVYIFSKSKGLYGGLSIDGSAILPKTEWNQAYYGVQASPAQILRGTAGTAPGAGQLKDSLANF
jgi:lipid-binding SYLF domain-containing protein